MTAAALAQRFLTGPVTLRRVQKLQAACVRFALLYGDVVACLPAAVVVEIDTLLRPEPAPAHEEASHAE